MQVGHGYSNFGRKCDSKHKRREQSAQFVRIGQVRGFQSEALGLEIRDSGNRQGDLMVTLAEMLRSPGHVFYDRLQKLLSRPALMFSLRRLAALLCGEDGGALLAGGPLFPNAHN